MSESLKTQIEITWLGSESREQREPDPLDIQGIDHLELLTGNARQACYFYSHAFGFKPIAYRGPETGHRDAVSYVLEQNKVKLVLTTPLSAHDWRTQFISTHGDSVQAVAFLVDDCESFYHETMKRGAQSAEVPRQWEDRHGKVRRGAIHTYGDTIHPIIERKGYDGIFWPGFVPFEDLFPELPLSGEVGFITVDHVVGNVELGKMNEWASFYENVLGFTQMLHFTDEDISTEYSALMSKVLTDGRKVKFPINEPAQGRRKSQIDEYLQFHNGPGVQHIAFLTKDVIATVEELRSRGVPFLYVPQTYYEELSSRVGEISEDIRRIGELGILVDRDEDGYLLQLFTKPVFDRPTLFFEVIQRRGSKGFGIGNFKALFESIEREQELRGNL